MCALQLDLQLKCSINAATEMNTESCIELLCLIFLIRRFQRGDRVCTKFVFGRGSVPEPAGGAYSAPSDPLAGFRGPYF